MGYPLIVLKISHVGKTFSILSIWLRKQGLSLWDQLVTSVRWVNVNLVSYERAHQTASNDVFKTLLFWFSVTKMFLTKWWYFQEKFTRKKPLEVVFFIIYSNIRTYSDSAWNSLQFYTRTFWITRIEWENNKAQQRHHSHHISPKPTFFLFFFHFLVR